MYKSILYVSLLFLFSTTAHAGLFGPNWTVYDNIPYGPNPSQLADVYLLNKGTNPAVVFIHGGGWGAGDKSAYAGYYAQLYANAGYNVFSINYRLAVQGNASTYWNAQLQDVQLAIRWIRANATTLKTDPTRIAAFGDSAGGQLALFLGSAKTVVPGDMAGMWPAVSPAAQVVVDEFGPADLTQPNEYTILQGLPVFDGGETYAQNPAVYWDMSPVRILSAATAPTCIIQGTLDTTVLQSQSLELQTDLKNLKVPNKYISYTGGHEYSGVSGSTKTSIDNSALSYVNGYLHPNMLNSW